MKKYILVLLILIIGSVFAFNKLFYQGSTEVWSGKQLISPAGLANTLNNPGADQPMIFSIGPSGLIKAAIDIGPVQEDENLTKLKKQLSSLSKDTAIVIYCGCCPFKNCPNIRPAFRLLNDMKFTNHKLLDLSHNFKVDWVDKGYPVNQ